MVSVYKRTLGWRARTAVLVVVVGVLVAGAFLLPIALGDGKDAVAAKHTATAKLFVSARPDRLLGEAEKLDRDSFELYKITQQELLRSGPVIRAALRKPEAKKLHLPWTDAPVDWVLDRLTVKFPGNAEVMAVSCNGDDEEESVALVNAVVEAYMSEVVEAESIRRREKVEAISRLCEEQKEGIRRLHEQVRSLAGWDSDPESRGIGQKIALNDLAQATAEAERARSEVTRLTAESAAQETLLELAQKTEFSTGADELIAHDPVATQLTIELVRKRMDLAHAESAGSSGATKAARAQSDIKVIEEQYARCVVALKERARSKQRDGLDREIVRLQALLAKWQERQVRLEKQVKECRETAARIGRTSVDIDILRLELKHQEEAYARLEAEKEKQTAELRASPRIRLIEEAQISGETANHNLPTK